jgi:redox-sensitive bicupin YhaK (pirin superfamily)
MEVLAIIPARGGSKGIPGKNIRDFAGHPLLTYSIAAGLQAELVTRVIVSTDSEAIAEVARRYGAETPFLRPAEFAQDNTLDLPVFQHALTWLAENEGYRPDIVVQLRPTSPVRPANLVDQAVRLLADHPEADSVRGVVPAGENPHKMWRIDPQGRMHGFQLWANLPASLKMTQPRYQDIPASAIPEIADDDGTIVRVICGEFWGKKGPVEGVAADPSYVDVSVAPGKRKRLKLDVTRNAFAYVFAGSGTFRDSSEPRAVLTEHTAKPEVAPVYDASNHSLVLFDRGDEIVVQAGDEGIRFLLVSGKPIEEPVAWYGPIVMNTQEQLRDAMRELQRGTFIKHS